MTHSTQHRRSALFVCMAVLFLTTTSASAQIIRPGGGGDSPCVTEGAQQGAQSTEQPPCPSSRLSQAPANNTAPQQIKGKSSATSQIALYRMLEYQERLLMSGSQEAGVYAIPSVARNSQDADLPSGMYLVRLSVGNHVQVHKVIFRN